MVIAASVGVATLAVPQSSASAAVITVTSTADGGPGSLRQAITSANTNGGANEIVLAASATYTLTDCVAGPLSSTAGPLTITGNGATIAQTCAGDGVIAQNSTTGLTATGVTIRGGDAIGNGGGIYSAGAVTLSAATITLNHAGNQGGGVYAEARATVVNSTVTTNTAGAYGGGLMAGRFDLTDATIESNSAPASGGAGAFGGPLGGSAPSTITRSTVSNNIGGGGGALLSLSVFDSTFENNTNGTGVSNGVGLLSITNSVVKDNRSSEAGGVYNGEGGLVIERSRITGNQSTGDGGGVLAGEVASITSSTIDGNSAASNGGGVYSFGDIALVNSTVVANTAVGQGGGLWSQTQLQLIYSTIAGNGAPLGANVRGTLRSRASVISGPVGGLNCATTSATPGTYVYDDDGSCGLGAGSGAGNVSNGPDPLLGPLVANGGPTPTRLPGFGSALSNAVPVAAGCVPTDQRGISRPQFDKCDIGAVEKNTTTGAAFYGVEPFRALDTRTGIGGPAGPVVAGAPRDLVVGGSSGVPATATAVVMNVTATGADADSFLTVWPTGQQQPGTSNINFAGGQTIANLVTVGLGAAGTVTLANRVGGVEVVADVVGYFETGQASGSFYNGIAPTRILDSRTSTGGWVGPLRAGAARDLPIKGAASTASIPVTATAVVANVTATGGDAGSFLRVTPSGVSAATSNVNFAPGQTIPNLVTVQIGANGAITFANAVGSVDVVVDVVGYYDPSQGARFYPLTPTRVLDDRVNVGATGPWGPGQTRSVAVAGAATAPAIPATASAVVTNLTATNATTGSFVTSFAAGSTAPGSSTLNFGPSETIANLAVVGVGAGGAIALSNQLGTVDLIGDATGFYANY